MTRTTRLLACAVLTAWHGAAAQHAAPSTRSDTVPPIAGDGRVHAPSDLEVAYAPLLPNAVTTVVLHPLEYSVLRFPYIVLDAQPADPGTFEATRIGNTVRLRVKDCLQGCATNLMVYLDDGDLTVVPFYLVVDTTRTVTMLRDFSDPISQRVHQTEARTAEALAQRAQDLVATHLDQEVERCMLTGFSLRPVNIANAWRDNATGESVGVTVQDIGYSGRCLQTPRLYIRYAIDNARYTTTQQITWAVVRYNRVTRQATAIPVLEDQRDPEHVPPLRQVRGQLVLDGTLMLAPNDEIRLTITIDGHVIALGSVLVAPEAKP